MEGKGKNKARRRNSSQKSRDSRRNTRDDKRFEKEDRVMPARNDISWYTRNPNLAVAAGSFPYPNRPGMNVQVAEIKTTSTAKPNTSVDIPGVMVLDWMPSLGRSLTATDPASVLGKEMYARVRQVYSGSLDVDAPDFVMYVMSLDSIFAYIAWLKRLYRTLNAYSPDNYATPDQLLSAMNVYGASVQNLRSGKARFWQVINELVLMTRKFTCPASMDVFNRHYWMNDNVYLDADSINSQFYLFNMRALYRFKEQNVGAGSATILASGLEVVDLPRGAAITPDSLFEYGQNLIEALVAWDDAYTINGYLKRAFEGDSLFIVEEIPYDAKLTPVYQPEVLMQIENSRGLDYPNAFLQQGYSRLAVTQDPSTNAVISNPGYVVKGYDAKDGSDFYNPLWHVIPKPWISVRSDAPTVADSIIASRLQSTVIDSKTIAEQEELLSLTCGTELAIAWYYVRGISKILFFQNDVNIMEYDTEDFVAWLMPDALAYTSAGRIYSWISTFDWHPFALNTQMFYCKTSQTTVTVGQQFCNVFGDTHNFTVIQPTDLANLHRVCVYSEFNSFGLIHD